MSTRTLLRSLLTALLMAVASGTHADDGARGRELYAPCAACHGERGEGNATVQAPSLAGLPEWYVLRQLRNFRGGLRGADEADTYGAQMARMAQQLWDDGEAASVSAYVAAFAPTTPVSTLRGGKASRGNALYATCAACHGADGTGNAELSAPPLVGRDDWYVVSQLAAFRDGTRGTHADDAPGLAMRAAATALPDEQAALDVAAHLIELRAARARDSRNRR